MLSRAADLPESPENPLGEPSFLQESQLIDVRFDALRSTVGLLLELRTAMHLSIGVAAAIVARNVYEVSWRADRATERVAWAVIGAECSSKDGIVEMAVFFSPSASLLIRAEFVEFYNLDVVGLSEEIPDYVEDDEVVIRANTASWESVITPLAASFISS